MSLQLYFIADEVNDPEDPTGLELLGSIDISEYHAMRYHWPACGGLAAIPYFDDARLDTREVRALAACIHSSVEASPSGGAGVATMLAMLDEAISASSGIASFCD